MAGGALPDIGEEFLFQRENLVLGVQHLALVILQLGRGEAFGVDQGLLALIVGGRQMLIGAGDLDVVAEDVIEAHFERGDAGALALAGLDLGDVPLAVLAQVAEFVELGMVSGADGAAIHQVERRFVGDGFEDEVGDVGKFVEPVVQAAQARRLLGVEAAFQRGEFFQRAAQSEHVARAGRAQGDFGQQAFQIEDAGEVLAQLRAQDGLLAQFAHRVQALFDFGAVHGGPQQALAEQTAAHTGEGLIQHAEHGELRLRATGVGGEDGLEQFQIAHGDGVQHHGIGAVVIGGAVEMVQRGSLRIVQVVEDGASGADGGGPASQAAAIQREQLEVIAQRAVAVIVGEDPVFQFGAHEAWAGAFRGREEGQVGGEEDFARAQLFQRAGHFGGLHFGDLELAGRDIHVGHGGPRSVARDGGQEVVLAGAHQGGVHGGAGRHHAHDLAFDQALGGFGIFHLVADGDAVSLLDEARDVALGRMEGDAAHGDGGALFLVARGEGDFQFARGHHGVLEEELVKIAEAEHQQGVGYLLLDAVVLPHERRGRVTHREVRSTQRRPPAGQMDRCAAS